MDLNYDIHTWDFSLRNAALTKITHYVVIAAKRNMHHHASNHKKIISKAKVIAENLDLLPGMIIEIKKLIPPIMWVLLMWNKINHHGISPILTPHGTVDVTKSVRAFIRSNDQDLPASRQFDIACDYCLEEEIFHFGKLLSEADKLTYETQQDHLRTMQGFWYSIYKGNFSRMQTLNDFSPANIEDGMNRAMHMQMFLVIKYFLKKASREIVQHIINDMSVSYFFFESNPSPDTIITLLQIDQRHDSSDRGYFAVLRSLLQWPYQHLFLKAAKTLAFKISLRQFWGVAYSIIAQPEFGYEDYNYKGLFVGFWKMRMDYAGAYVNPDYMRILLRLVFRLRDKHIAFMVFDDISERNKEEFWPKFNCICDDMIREKKYKSLMFMMDVCKVKVEPFYLRFKKSVEENCFDNVFKRLMSEWESSEEPEK